jgi:hypothetical protein
MVLGRAAWLTGLVEWPVDLSAEDLPSLFNM